MEEYIGIIKIFGGNFAPRGWVFCDGRLLSISEYTAVFSLLGTTFGGDGVTTFGVPDLRGRRPIGQGTGPGLSSYTPGQVAGSEEVTLTTTNIPAHTHALNVSNTSGTINTPSNTNSIGAAVDINGDNVSSFSTVAPNTPLLPSSIGIQGGNQPHENLAPYLAVNYIICLEGIYPSRN